MRTQLTLLIFVGVVLACVRDASAQIQLDGSNHCTNTGSSVTSVSCTLSSVASGDLITVEFSDRNGYETAVSDGTNGVYTKIYYVSDSADPNYSGMAYFMNSASGNLTVNVALSASDPWAKVSVQAWKGAATSSVLDTGAITQHQTSTSGTVANSTCGSTQSPAASGELVIAYLVPDYDTSVTAGTNYTIIDSSSGPGNPGFPEYWIQTSTTATNGPYTNAADDWTDGCAAFKPAPPPSTQIQLDGSNHCTNTGSSVTSVSCTLSSVASGDLITVEFSDRNGYETAVSDGTNGVYTKIYYVSDSADPNYSGMAYFMNSASGNLTVNVALSASDPWAKVSVQAWKGAATSSVLDTGAITQHQTSTSGTVANSTCGSTQSPAASGELVIAYLVPDYDTSVTAGTNYTIIDSSSGPGNPGFPEYWIQTSTTATNGPYTNAADDWTDGCAAFKPAPGGSLPTPTLSVSSSLNPSDFGQDVVFVAAVSSGPTGTITFYDDGTEIGTGPISGTIASYSTSALSVGSHSITASWPGNSSYNAVTSSPLTQTVNQGSPTSGTVYSYSASYDAVGNVSSFTDYVMGTWSMANGYDTLNRLVKAQVSSGPYSGQYGCWGYDAFGNRLSEAVSSTTCTNSPPLATWATYNTSNSNRMDTTSRNLNQSNGYDASGDVTNDGAYQYLYDADGRVCAVLNLTVGAMTGYVYDADGTRVAKGSIRILSCDPTSNGFQATEAYVIGPSGQQVTEMGSAGNGSLMWQRTYAYADGNSFAEYDSVDQHFRLTDWLGTLRATTDHAGLQEGTCPSLPFGDFQECTYSTDTHYFTGKERDAESGNDYFGARYYGSSMGRFLSADSGGIGFSDFNDPQSLNLYSYGLNNPLTSTDPTGHSVQICTTLNGTQHCTTMDDDQYAAAQQAKNSGGLSGPSLADLQNSSSGAGNITDSNGNTVGTVQWTPDNPGIQGPAAMQGFGQIAHDSQGAINYFMLNMATTLAGGVAGKAVEGVVTGYVNAGKLGMLKPLVTNPKLAAVVEKLFQATDSVPGGTAGAVRFESESGVMLSPAGHAQDAQDIIGELNNLLKNPNAGWSSNDQAVAKELIRDLQNALSGK